MYPMSGREKRCGANWTANDQRTSRFLLRETTASLEGAVRNTTKRLVDGDLIDEFECEFHGGTTDWSESRGLEHS